MRLVLSRYFYILLLLYFFRWVFLDFPHGSIRLLEILLSIDLEQNHLTWACQHCMDKHLLDLWLALLSFPPLYGLFYLIELDFSLMLCVLMEQ